MDLALLVYAVSLLDGFKTFFTLGVIFSALSATGFGIAAGTWRFDASEYTWNLNRDGTVKESILATRRLSEKFLKWSVIIFIFSGLCNILLPSERTAYMMVGAYAAQKVSQNEKVQETGQKVLKLIEKKLDSYIEESEKGAKKLIEGRSKE